MNTPRSSLAALAAVLLAVSAFAVDLTGSWKTADRADGKRTDILDIVKFELKDGKLAGAVEGIDRTSNKVHERDFSISNLTFKDGVVTFNLTRDMKRVASEAIQPMGSAGAVAARQVDDITMVSKYEAKLDGDTLKGTVERIGRNGKPHKTSWNATRLK